MTDKYANKILKTPFRYPLLAEQRMAYIATKQTPSTVVVVIDVLKVRLKIIAQSANANAIMRYGILIVPISFGVLIIFFLAIENVATMGRAIPKK